MEALLSKLNPLMINVLIILTAKGKMSRGEGHGLKIVYKKWRDVITSLQEEKRSKTAQAVEKVLPAKGFGGKDSWKGNRQGSLSLKSTTF